MIFPQPVLQEAYDYWLSKQSDNLLPGRRHIDPAEIKNILPFVSLVDVVVDGDNVLYRSRLVGTEIVRHFGRDITGKFAHELYSADYLTQINEIYGEVLKRKTSMMQECDLQTADRTLTYDRLILPLAADGRQVDMLLIVFAFPEDVLGWKTPARPGSSRWVDVAAGE